jgi:hypothetical protein
LSYFPCSWFFFVRWSVEPMRTFAYPRHLLPDVDLIGAVVVLCGLIKVFLALVLLLLMLG